MAQRVKLLPEMQEIRVQSLGQEDPLEKEVAAHSSTPAWKIPWMEKPGRLQSMGSQSWTRLSNFMGFPGGSDSKAPVCNAGDPGSIPGLGRSSGEGNGSPLWYSCLENPMDEGAW